MLILLNCGAAGAAAASSSNGYYDGDYYDGYRRGYLGRHPFYYR
jgi:hypothetical protein